MFQPQKHPTYNYTPTPPKIGNKKNLHQNPSTLKNPYSPNKKTHLFGGVKHTLLGTVPYPLFSSAFWVDDFPNFPWKVGYVGVEPKIGGKNPKWMVYFMENPKTLIKFHGFGGGVFHPLFLVQHPYVSLFLFGGYRPIPEISGPFHPSTFPRKGTHRHRDIGQPQLQLLPVPALRDPSVATNVGWPVSAVYILMLRWYIEGERYKKHR